MWIDTRPSLGRRSPCKILMRADMIVEETELAQRAIERIEGCDRELIQIFFQRAEETLDPPVLPRAMQIGCLMADAEQKQRQAKNARGKDRLVVRSDHLGFAIAPDRGSELAHQRPARFAVNRFECKRCTARMFDDAQHQPRLAIERRLAGKIERPDQVTGNRLRPCVFDLPPDNKNLMLRKG